MEFRFKNFSMIVNLKTGQLILCISFNIGWCYQLSRFNLRFFFLLFFELALFIMHRKFLIKIKKTSVIILHQFYLSYITCIVVLICDYINISIPSRKSAKQALQIFFFFFYLASCSRCRKQVPFFGCRKQIAKYISWSREKKSWKTSIGHRKKSWNSSNCSSKKIEKFIDWSQENITKLGQSVTGKKSGNFSVKNGRKSCEFCPSVDEWNRHVPIGHLSYHEI